MKVIGWDIGGANLKASDGEAASIELPFPMWKCADDLSSAVRSMARRFERADMWAVTMTGELADCFETKSVGVGHILKSMERAADGVPIAVWTTTGEFVDIPEAVEWPRLVAAANWHGLATWVGRMAPNGAAVLIDVGSTTTDIIPLADGFPCPTGRTDVERLISGELVYTGSRRTPLCAIVNAVQLSGRPCPLAAELFSTSLDVYLLTGDLPESDEDDDTANGRPATKLAAHDRIARSLCCDREELDFDSAVDIAKQIASRQTTQIAIAIRAVTTMLPAAPQVAIVSGSGEFLARRSLHESGVLASDGTIFSLGEVLGRDHSASACAFALARLATERIVISHGEQAGGQ